MKILNLGSMNIDRVYSVEHYAQAGETIPAKTYGEFCGGKGLNQSIALARAGAEVFHAGCVGDDGDILLDTMAAAGVRTELIRESGEPSGHAVIHVDHEGQNKITIFGGANSDVTPAYIDEVLAHFSPGEMLLLQNEISNVPYAIEKGREQGMKVVFNPSPMGGDIGRCDLRKVDYLILNEVEGRQLAGTDAEDTQTILEKLRQKYPQTVLVLTLGSRGSCYADGKETFYQGIFPAKTVDTTGAGDTFTGYFLAGIAAGRPPREAMEYAALASAISVGRHGAAPSIPDGSEVRLEMARLKEEYM
ncbi:MAG: ribokinase [Lachnospiraceae bacterium]|nr:ribokinase [Lachnospiraceae bacterium]MDE6600801.1 ribokinase [Lachnospiraceae bacterium]